MRARNVTNFISEKEQFKVTHLQDNNICHNAYEHYVDRPIRTLVILVINIDYIGSSYIVDVYNQYNDIAIDD